MIPEEVLILVIRRVASELLDRRLAGNLKESNHGEDISTVAKIAKAINKVSFIFFYTNSLCCLQVLNLCND